MYHLVLKFIGLKRKREKDKEEVISFLKRNNMPVLSSSGDFMEISAFLFRSPYEIESLMEMRSTYQFVLFSPPIEKTLEIDTKKVERIKERLYNDMEKVHQNTKPPWVKATLRFPVQGG